MAAVTTTSIALSLPPMTAPSRRTSMDQQRPSRTSMQKDDDDVSEYDYDLEEDKGLFLQYMRDNRNLAQNKHFRKIFETLQLEMDKINEFYNRQESTFVQVHRKLHEQVKELVHVHFANHLESRNCRK